MVENVANMAAYVLPVSQKFINGVPVPQGRKTLRLKEKYIILLVFVTFGLVCFGAFFFLPDLRDRVRLNNIRGVDEMMIPRRGIDKGQVIKHDDEHVHLNDEKLKFKEQVNRDVDIAKIGKKLNISEHDAANIKKSIDSEKEEMANLRKEEARRKAEEEKEKDRKVETEHEGGEGGQGGAPSNPEVKKKRDKVREVRNIERKYWNKPF